MPGEPTIIYIDPLSVGHRVEHLAFYLRVCEAAGLRLGALVPSELWKAASNLAGSSAQSGEHIGDVRSNSLAEKVALLDTAEEVASMRSAALVFFPLVDDFVLPMLRRRLTGRPFAAPWTGVFFRDNFNFPMDLPLEKRLKAFAKGAALRMALACGANTLFTFNKDWKLRVPVHVIWLPDALSTLDRAASEVGTSLGWPVPNAASARKRLLMFGALEPRKGLVEFAEALLDLPDGELARIEFRALGQFMGRHEAYRARANTLLAELSRRGATVELIDGYVSEAVLDQALRQCDYVVAPYIGHQGSSGVVGLAAQYGRPVLSQHGLQVGAEIRRYDLGVAVKCSDRRSLMNAIRMLLACDATPGMRRFRDERGPERAFTVMRETLSELVRNPVYKRLPQNQDIVA